MDHISTLIPKVLKKRGLKDQADASLVVHEAQVWLTKCGVPEGVEVQKLQEAELWIEVPSSIAAQECHTLSPELLDHLKRKFADLKIERIRIVRKTD